MPPLEGLSVLDFSTLLPGPLASLMLAEAGARVLKVERPHRGDEMRSYEPKFGTDSVNFALLNRGKDSLAIDLKAADAAEKLRPLIIHTDVLIEQFRPGVMQRLGLGYEVLSRLNPRLIYCSVTGWGQTGPHAAVAAHDLNYMAETGLLGLTCGADGAPTLPPLLVADIAGGALPAVINILLALRQREQTGMGCHLDVAMADNLFTFSYWGLGNGFSGAGWPRAGAELVTGDSPRYQIYKTADDRYLAAAPLEDKFWQNFADIIGLPAAHRTPDADARAAIAAVAAIIASRSSTDWQAAFSGRDVCCSIVATLEEAVQHPQFVARQLFARQQVSGDKKIPVLPLPVATIFRSHTLANSAPELGRPAT